jgi:NitT/TauT family transport system ATP-binding protein
MGEVLPSASVRPRERATPAVALDDVTVSFAVGDGGGSYTAVERAALAVNDGEFVALVGPTGCGKSTILNVAAGLIAPSGGHVDVYAARLAGPQPAGGLSVSLSPDALFPRPRLKTSCGSRSRARQLR